MLQSKKTISNGRSEGPVVYNVVKDFELFRVIVVGLFCFMKYCSDKQATQEELLLFSKMTLKT